MAFTKLQTSTRGLLSHRFVRLLLVAVGIGVCLWTIRETATLGFSRMLVRNSLSTGDLATANDAIRLTPNDATAHLAGASALSLSSQPSETVKELERAVALRPADYLLWSALGLLRDQMGDTTAALSAYDQAVRLAPFYAQPRWRRGNVLLRTGKYDAAFQDLNHAAQSNPELIPSLLDLAWSISKGDAALTEQLAQVRTEKTRIAFARFLARQGRAKDAVAQFRAAGNIPGEVRRELVERMLAKGAFQEAFEVWTASEESNRGNESAGAAVYDGGFEGSLAFDQVGFGWIFPRGLPAVNISMESGQPHSGSKNLRIDFGGNSNPGSALVSQLIISRPSKRYRVNFAARSQEVVTGGLPVVIVEDASAQRKRLGRSGPLSKGSHGWQVFSFEFTTEPTTTAVVLSLQRESCTTSPCPIFGSISLDSFSLEELK